MQNILIINGSYRDNGVTDQIVREMRSALEIQNTKVENINLRDFPIEFCLNCRECTQSKGSNPGKCVINDDMQKLIDKIEKSDAYIFASPTNFGSVTAVFKRFMERLIVYGYWPWSEKAPKNRKKDSLQKSAVVVSSCAAPSLLAPFIYGTHKQLKTTAKVVGAKVVGSQFAGLISSTPDYKLSQREKQKAQKLASKLITNE